jgi:probable rRNA maturation factor
MKTARRQPLLTIRFRLDAEPFPIEQAELRSLVRKVLKQFGVSRAEVDIVIADDAEMQTMHQRYFQDPRTTDVISFDLSEPGENPRCFQILVNAAMALRQARRRRHSPQAELSLYLVHGLLHNLGFDDADARSAKQMHQTEDQLLQSFGYPPVFRSARPSTSSRRQRRE